MSKSNIFKRVLLLVGVFACAILMWIFEKGCLVKSITGIICPSCGMTRAFFAFVNGDFARSFELHPMLLSVPVLSFLFVFYDKLFMGKAKIPSIVLLVSILLGFAINYIHQLSLL